MADFRIEQQRIEGLEDKLKAKMEETAQL